MSQFLIEISIPADEEGYISFECPYCKNRFKLEVNEFKDSSVTELYCPYCGLRDDINNFYNSDVIEKVEEIATNYAIDLINNMFKDFERSTRGNKNIRVKTKNIKKVSEKNLYENVDEYEIVPLNNCCNKAIKVPLLEKLIGVYCPYCGMGEL